MQIYLLLYVLWSQYVFDETLVKYVFNEIL